MNDDNDYFVLKSGKFEGCRLPELTAEELQAEKRYVSFRDLDAIREYSRQQRYLSRTAARQQRYAVAA